MKGKKMVFAVMLSLIVCLLVLPTCAFADEEVIIENPVTDPATGGVPPTTIVEGENNLTSQPDASGEKQTTTTDTTTTETTTTTTTTTETTSTETTTTETTTTETTTTTTETTTDENVSDVSDKGGSSFMVEFSYGDKSYKLDDLKGNEQFGLAEILKELGIEGSIDDAKGDADDLFAAENGENGWNVTTKKAFSSKQTMTVIVDGVEYVLNVIDDQNVSTAEELKAAIEAVKSGESPTFKLVADIAGNFEIKAGKTITIDLNGHTLTNSGVGAGITIHNYGTLTIKDSDPAKKGKLTTQGGGDSPALFNEKPGVVTLESGLVTRESSVCYVIDNRGKITVKDDATVDGGDICWTVVNNHVSGTITIDGGTFKSRNINGDYNRLIQNCGSITVNGGTFEREGNGCLIGNYYQQGVFSAKTTINGGNFKKVNDKSDIFDVSDNSTFVIKGGSYSDDSVKEFVSNNSSFEEKDGIIVVKYNGTTLNSAANTIALTSDAPVFKYMVVEGKDQTWTKSGNETLNYVLNADANNLIKVLIDGEEVEFEIDENGEVVISAEVLEKLEAGEYEIEFIFADGSCKTKLFVK